jgi:hypothetical protein
MIVIDLGPKNALVTRKNTNTFLIKGDPLIEKVVVKKNVEVEGTTLDGSLVEDFKLSLKGTLFLKSKFEKSGIDVKNSLFVQQGKWIVAYSTDGEILGKLPKISKPVLKSYSFEAGTLYVDQQELFDSEGNWAPNNSFRLRLGSRSYRIYYGS